MDTKFLSRKFIIACATLVVSAGGLFFGVLDGGEFVAAITIILGMYNAANSGIKVAKVNKGQNIEE